ncbi:MAG TPA: fumarylacetoacetase [Thermoanaerobaculia bacterium]|nr:fumarylacetoacetase [Thermoanaerobaculia bacterium]
MALVSWIDSANISQEFPLENLPLGVFRAGRRARIGVAIGDRILDLGGAFEDGLIHEEACTRDTLNDLMARGREASRTLRARLIELLSEGSPDRHRTAKHLLPRQSAELLLPAAIGDYTDFYASLQHATNVGTMMRPDNPLLPNYKWIPIGYHGRASSIVVSGTPVRRPWGQLRDDAAKPPELAPSRRLDYELEVGAFIARGNALGHSIPIGEAGEHVFGFCLLNDWSARDIQTWEYQPLGPFLAKSFATSISPWVVMAEALEPFRLPPPARAEGDPAPLPHLAGGEAYDITLEVWIKTAKMTQPVRISRGNFREMYWTVAQLVAHHSSNGCNLRPGDLLGSGTVSGAEKDARGCLLERTWRGTEPLELPSGETRRFLEDGDEVILRGHCAREGATRIGFGECRGTVTAALS